MSNRRPWMEWILISWVQACHTFVSGVCKVNYICLHSAVMTSLGFSPSVNNAYCTVWYLNARFSLAPEWGRAVKRGERLQRLIVRATTLITPQQSLCTGAWSLLKLDFCCNSQLGSNSERVCTHIRIVFPQCKLSGWLSQQGKTKGKRNIITFCPFSIPLLPLF